MPQAKARERTAIQSPRVWLELRLVNLRASLIDGQCSTWAKRSGANARNRSASNQWASDRKIAGDPCVPSRWAILYALKERFSMGISNMTSSRICECIQFIRSTPETRGRIGPVRGVCHRSMFESCLRNPIHCAHHLLCKRPAGVPAFSLNPQGASPLRDASFPIGGTMAAHKLHSSSFHAPGHLAITWSCHGTI